MLTQVTNAVPWSCTERNVGVRMTPFGLFRREAIRIVCKRIRIYTRIAMQSVGWNADFTIGRKQMFTWKKSWIRTWNEWTLKVTYRFELGCQRTSETLGRSDRVEVFLWCNNPNISVRSGLDGCTDDLNRQKRFAIPRKLCPVKIIRQKFTSITEIEFTWHCGLEAMQCRNQFMAVAVVSCPLKPNVLICFEPFQT